MIQALEQHYERFHQQKDSNPVASQNLDMAFASLQEKGCGFTELNRFIADNVQPFLSSSNGGRYLGFVTGGANPVATYADWLVSTFDQNVSKGGDSIATSIEYQALEWLCELFSLPTSFSGIFTTGATAANFLASITARQYLGAQQNIDVAKNGMAQLDVKIYSATPHASMVKSLGMAGFGQNNWEKIPSLENSEAMQTDALEQALGQHKLGRAMVIASAATVTGTDFDDLIAISRLCKKYGAWLHVDAAFGIFERLLNGSDGKTKGIELADSITLDCHKWLNVPYDCGVLLTRHKQMLQDSCDVPAPYLAVTESHTPFMALGIENSRRFRAFPAWATMKAYGIEGIRQAVAANVKHAQRLASWIKHSDGLKLVKECDLNVVLFKPNPDVFPLSSAEVMNALNKQGDVFFSPGNWNGESIIRAAFSNWSTTDEDVDKIIAALSRLGTDISMNWSKAI